MASSGKVIFKAIYDSHNFIYRKKSKKNRIGYVEEDLFAIPPFLLPTGGHVDMGGELQLGYPEGVARGDTIELRGNNHFPDQYVSVELKLKCGMKDYSDMVDRYNIQQLIKQRNRHYKHLSLYVPSNFFELTYWEIFRNLNLAFLSNSNNVHLYVNGNRRVDTALHSMDHFRHLFYNDPLGPFAGEKDPQGKLYVAHLNSDRSGKTVLPCASTEQMKKTQHTEGSSPEGEVSIAKDKRTDEDIMNDYLKQLNRLQMEMSWKNANRYNILDYCHRVGSDAFLEGENCGFLAKCAHDWWASSKWPQKKKLSYSGHPYMNYAYRNYIFSNNFFFKYVIPCTCQEVRKALLSLKKGDYSMCLKKLVTIFDTYKDIYYINLITLLKSVAHIICERCVIVAPTYLHHNPFLRIKRKENTLWNVNLAELEEQNGGKGSSNNAPHHGNQRHNRATTTDFILACRKSFPLKEWKRDLLFFLKEAQTDKTKWKKLLKVKFTQLKEVYNEMSNTYSSVFNKLQEDYLTMLMEKLGVQEKTWSEVRSKVDEIFIHRMKNDFVYLYDRKVKTNYYYNWFITNQFNLTVKLYFQQCHYHLRGLLNQMKVMYTEKGYEERINKAIAHLQGRVKKALWNFATKNEYSFEIREISHLRQQNGGNANLINYLLFRKNELNKDRYSVQTKAKKERLVMLINIIEKEKFLFYKLLYFHCFSAGQIQIVHCMLLLIKIFEKLFFLKKSEDIFSSFAYYHASLENFTSTDGTNSYIEGNKHLSRFIDVKRIRALSQCVLSNPQKKESEEPLPQTTTRRGTPKHSAFTYLQNTHFLMGNELIIDAIGVVNKFAKSRLTYIQSEMKNCTRKLYYGLYRNVNQYAKKYTPMYKPSLKKKVNRKKLMRRMLSSETLITMEHFNYLTSESLKSKLNKKTIIVNRKRDIPKKAMRIYKNMIFFICRFLISRTLCDNSTIFNIYAKEDNRYDDEEVLQRLEANRFKPLIVKRRGRSRRSQGVSNVTCANGVDQQDGNAMDGEKEANSDQKSVDSPPTALCTKKKNKKYIPTKRFTSYAYPLRSTHLRREKEKCSREDNREFRKVVENAYIPRGSKKIFYRISLIDVSMKSISKMSYWEEQMSQIISHYRELCAL